MKDPFNSMQAMFQPPAAIRNATAQRLTDFWSNQGKILDGMEEYAHVWFERRHTGTHSALTASRRLSLAETPGDMIREYQTWAMGCFRRLMDDNLACYQQWMAMGERLARPPSSSGETNKINTGQADSRDNQVRRSKAA
jgi:hypothetical protein